MRINEMKHQIIRVKKDIHTPSKTCSSGGLLLSCLVRFSSASGSSKLGRIENARPFRFGEVTVTEDGKRDMLQDPVANPSGCTLLTRNAHLSFYTLYA